MRTTNAGDGLAQGWHDGVIDTARLDVWLWAVRLTPTRSAATELCRAGRVSLNGATAKAASGVKPGDRVEVRLSQRHRVVEVAQVIAKRVGAPVAVECYVDHSPPVPTHVEDPAFRRERGSGRPTKRDRRQLDRLRKSSG